jgi:RNA polymerase sigma factor (sigma-70 family)
MKVKYQHLLEQYPERKTQIQEIYNSIAYGNPMGEILFIKRTIDDDSLMIIKETLNLQFPNLLCQTKEFTTTILKEIEKDIDHVISVYFKCNNNKSFKSNHFNLSNENRIISYANWKMLFSLQEATKNEDNINNDDYELNNISCEDDVEYCDKECFEQYYDEDEQDSDYDTNNNDGYIDYYEDEYGVYQIKELIDTLLSDLSGREYDMICMYYGVNEYKKEHTLNEIGEKHNITKERVRQIIEKCKRKMRIKALVENKYYA